MRRLVNRKRPRMTGDLLKESASLPGFSRQETEKRKPIGGHPGDREQRRYSCRPRYRYNGVARCCRGANQLNAGIADKRRAGLADEGNILALGEVLKKAGQPSPYVGVKETDQSSADAVPRQEFARRACILSGHKVNLAKDAQGARGDVLKISDWSGDDVQRATPWLILNGCVIMLGHISGSITQRGPQTRWRATCRSGRFPALRPFFGQCRLHKPLDLTAHVLVALNAQAFAFQHFGYAAVSFVLVFFDCASSSVAAPRGYRIPWGRAFSPWLEPSEYGRAWRSFVMRPTA